MRTCAPAGRSAERRRGMGAAPRESRHSPHTEESTTAMAEGTVTEMVTSAPGRITSLTEPTDRELVAAIRLGDDRAFEILYERHQGRVTTYVHGMLRDRHRAEDV